MRLAIGAVLMFAIALVVGLGTTLFTATRNISFDTIRIGAWQAAPRTGTSSIDPYAQAAIARAGMLPISSGDGIAFTARTDDAGRLLDGRCDIQIQGITPPARYWTLTLYDNEGQLVANALDRNGFTSQEVARDANGGITINIAPRARAGNWLPSSALNQIVLVMRLYDTPVGVGTRTTKDTPMPAITTRSCP